MPSSDTCHSVSVLWWSYSSAADGKSFALLIAVVAQLVERSVPIPEVRGSNRVNGKIYIEHLFTYCQLY